MAAPFGIEGVTSRAVNLDGLRLVYLTAGSDGPDEAVEGGGDGENGTGGAGGTTANGGSEPPVILLHGGGLDRAALSWKHTISALAADRRVYAPDWPGFGERDRLVPVEWAVRADVLLPDVEMRVVPDRGHWPPRERPETTKGYLRELC